MLPVRNDSYVLTPKVNVDGVTDDDPKLILRFTTVLTLIAFHRGLNRQLTVSHSVPDVRQGSNLEMAGKITIRRAENFVSDANYCNNSLYCMVKCILNSLQSKLVFFSSTRMKNIKYQISWHILFYSFKLQEFCLSIIAICSWCKSSWQNNTFAISNYRLLL